MTIVALNATLVHQGDYARPDRFAIRDIQATMQGEGHTHTMAMRVADGPRIGDQIDVTLPDAT